METRGVAVVERRGAVERRERQRRTSPRPSTQDRSTSLLSPSGPRRSRLNRLVAGGSSPQLRPSQLRRARPPTLRPQRPHQQPSRMSSPPSRLSQSRPRRSFPTGTASRRAGLPRCVSLPRLVGQCASEGAHLGLYFLAPQEKLTPDQLEAKMAAMKLQNEKLRLKRAVSPSPSSKSPTVSFSPSTVSSPRPNLWVTLRVTFALPGSGDADLTLATFAGRRGGRVDLRADRGQGQGGGRSTQGRRAAQDRRGEARAGREEAAERERAYLSRSRSSSSLLTLIIYAPFNPHSVSPAFHASSSKLRSTLSARRPPRASSPRFRDATGTARSSRAPTAASASTRARIGSRGPTSGRVGWSGNGLQWGKVDNGLAF